MPGFRLLQTLMNERGEMTLDEPEERPEWKLEQKLMEPVNLFTDIFGGETPKDSIQTLKQKFRRGGFTPRREVWFKRLYKTIFKPGVD